MKRGAKIAIAAAAAVVIVGGAVYGVVKASPQQTTIPPVTQVVESKCGLSGTPGNPAELPVKWELVYGYSLPISSTDGAGVRNASGSWSCYAHTEAGAVLAGYTISLMASGLAEDWQTVVREQTVPGPGQDALLASTPTKGEALTVLGFNVSGYTPDRATIAYYLQSPSMTATCTADVAWLDGDWRLKLQADGSTLSGCSQGVPESFVPWGP